MTGLRWSRRTTTRISEELCQLGIAVCPNTVARLLHQMGYSLRVTHKQISTDSSPDRNLQFEYLAELRSRFHQRAAVEAMRGERVLSLALRTVSRPMAIRIGTLFGILLGGTSEGVNADYPGCFGARSGAVGAIGSELKQVRNIASQASRLEQGDKFGLNQQGSRRLDIQLPLIRPTPQSTRSAGADFLVLSIALRTSNSLFRRRSIWNAANFPIHGL